MLNFQQAPASRVLMAADFGSQLHFYHTVPDLGPWRIVALVGPRALWLSAKYPPPYYAVRQDSNIDGTGLSCVCSVDLTAPNWANWVDFKRGGCAEQISKPPAELPSGQLGV